MSNQNQSVILQPSITTGTVLVNGSTSTTSTPWMNGYWPTTQSAPIFTTFDTTPYKELQKSDAAYIKSELDKLRPFCRKTKIQEFRGKKLDPLEELYMVEKPGEYESLSPVEKIDRLVEFLDKIINKEDDKGSDIQTS